MEDVGSIAMGCTGFLVFADRHLTARFAYVQRVLGQSR